jgi:hypothetical protein
MSERTGLQTANPTTVVPGLLLQRKCACGNHSAAGECEGCEKKRGMFQRKAAGSTATSRVPLLVDEVLSSPGQPLDAETRAFFEPRFGHDFSSVPVRTMAQRSRNSLTIGPAGDPYEQEAERISDRMMTSEPERPRPRASMDFGNVRLHTDAKAAESARAVGALAYTVGSDVVFGAGRYAPQTREGSRLIAHELTHVVQQGGLAENLQRDVAIEPVASEPDIILSRGEIVGALAHNRTWFTNRALISEIRDLVGIARTPAVIDEEFVLAVARWQAANGITQDGRIGRITKIYMAEEFEAEGLPLIAQQLRGVAPASHVVDIDNSFCGCQPELSDSISENLDFITEYQACRNNPSNHTGNQIENCVTAAFAARGISLSTAGTTSSAGTIQVAPVAGQCGQLTRSETFAHEWSHSTHQRELVRRFGSGTPAFNRAWNESTDWANDEIRSRVVGNNFLLWVIARLNQLCNNPAGP